MQRLQPKILKRVRNVNRKKIRKNKNLKRKKSRRLQIFKQLRRINFFKKKNFRGRLIRLVRFTKVSFKRTNKRTTKRARNRVRKYNRKKLKIALSKARNTQLKNSYR